MESSRNQLPGISYAMDEDDEDTTKVTVLKLASTSTHTDIAVKEIESVEPEDTANMNTHLDALKLPGLLPGISGTRSVLERYDRAFQPPQKNVLSRGKVFLLLGLLFILVINATIAGYAQFIGPQGWAYVLGGPSTSGNKNLIQVINKGLRHPTPRATGQPGQQLTPQQYIDLIVQNMTLDQKLGQMMIVQFVGPTYGLDISTMISQYDVGAVLLFTANNNIVDKTQLKDLIAQMKSDSTLPLAVAIDQEGGTVDRLVNLDGPRPSEAEIGATNDPAKAMAEGMQDAKDLSSYGFNLNLAPVVDVSNTYNSQLVDRTYGNNAALVTEMAQAYLQGLQQSGKVLGTLKHFPGLGDVNTDPHIGVPDLNRSKNDLEAIDWAPYRSLIKQGNVYAVMVTHELVSAVDTSIPSSLSYKVVTGILRDEFGFQGVIMTDSLTMESITAYYSEGQAAALAVEAGNDLLMGASTPRDVASMIEGIKQAMAVGAISQQRIDDSVRRILMLKYKMGLLPLPK
ncbi:MAG TPA: glycoside hydrolase family 3 N-terminal domain-containing protein [Ktedonobacteraceae bacterium]|nr:glycoside hydrolase family 3 N-terminal domain-containing protein [Ktedonobacteraceae bacterium]